MVYEPTGRRLAFWFDSGFAGQLDAWVGELAADLRQPVVQLDTYGSWIDGRGQCDSWHHSGRAFDLARIRLTDGRVVSCRYDQWRDAPTAEADAIRRAYWAVAAGLHLRFAYVLTYLYDAQHANHIHLDNGRSGPDLSTFRTRSRVQVQAVQAILTYLWAEPVELTGRWDGPTRDAARRVPTGWSSPPASTTPPSPGTASSGPPPPAAVDERSRRPAPAAPAWTGLAGARAGERGWLRRGRRGRSPTQRGGVNRRTGRRCGCA